jgi:hypothetical protein
MNEDLVLPVPEMLPAMYLVPVSMPRERAIALTGAAPARHVAEPVRGLTRGLLGTSALVVAPRAAEIPDGQVMAFAALNPPLPGPVHEWTTRAASAAFAAELGRFGLPELRLDDVPAELHPWWTVALTALGHRLLELLRRELRRGAAAFVRVPELTGVRRTDIGSAYGRTLTGAGDPVPVRLSLDPSVTDRLESHLTGDPAEHRLTINSTLLAQGMPATGGGAPRARRSRRAAAARRRVAAAPARPAD